MTAVLPPLGPPLDPLCVGAAVGLLALVLARAVLHKLSGFAEFRQALADYRLLPEPVAGAAAAGLAAAEAAAAALLLVPGLTRVGALLAAGLMLLYGGAMAVNLLRGRSSIDCGCGGPGQAISWLLVARNLALAALAVVALAPVAARPLGPFDAVLLPSLALGGWLLLLIGERLVQTRSHIRAVAADRGGF
ncbi:Methylamine utilisation protein MauE [Tistlia consotensis]|uniref:Methylamine utilization protein MauE n=1 Tax=Tistlia consotensis USBA 355 TaxID=560819 RepID=A0A1Y6BCX3_9PROT|nr:MauE/DoxX family redox-associated membrane protein [Tistlia consotensis]SME97244.1 Methylamine utilisation protein MauE [Tistlia consotensis USBA 355]SNR56638.1 Methylamine utilisation protein MauE [Tistlia consotensis]